MRSGTSLPSQETVKNELERVQYRSRYKKVIFSTAATLITVAAVAVLVATLWMPVLQIYGSAMTPTLGDGDVLVSVKGTQFGTGDIIAFYYNNKILVKRVIAKAGDIVDIQDDGNVLVNGVPLEEPYLTEKALGNCDIELPYQVPAAKLFVMGDHRSTSADSRNTAIGCVAEEQIVGKIVFCVWPISVFGSVS